jgi:hypothetical protein
VLASGPLKIYIQPSDGFESYIAAAFVKKRVPAVITTDSHSSSRYTLTSAVRSKDETGFGKWVRCAYVLCMGMEGFQTATVQLVNTNKEVVWAYNVRKGHSQNYQSSAEAIAKHIKKFLEMRPL